LYNVIQAPNLDRIQLLHKRIFKVGYSSGNDSGNRSNNDFKFNQKFSINVTKYLPKVIKFDDADQDPSIRHTYMLITPFSADGTTQSNSNIVAQCQWELNYTFEDA